MTTWYTSDLHLGHQNIVKWRPFETLDEHNRTIIDNWNNVVQPDDTVYVLGDVVMGKRELSLPMLDELNGNKLLVPGNHDYVHSMNSKKHVERWTPEYGKYFTVLDQYVEKHELVDGLLVDLCHFPVSLDHDDPIRFPEWRPDPSKRWLIHGHLHGSYGSHPAPFHIDVGVDNWGFTPISADKLANIMTSYGSDG